MEIRLWKELLDPYEQAVSELVLKLRNVRAEHIHRNRYCPIESVQGRVKEVASILHKMHRKGIPFERMEEQIEDIAGIRVICQFEEDIETVADLLAERDDLELIERKDYLSNQKESGYRSLHLVAGYSVHTLNGKKHVLVEIQIRTMAMNFWATAEHSLQYKYREKLPPYVARQLSMAASVTADLDRVMSSVRSEIMDAETNSRNEARLIRDILNNIESLYKLENKREAEKIQDEFYRVFQQNDLIVLQKFHDRLDLLAEDYRAQTVEHEKKEPI